MKFKIRNFRGATMADIELNKVTLVGGKNNNGKTSICHGIASVMTGACPIPGLLKGQYKNLVRDGAPSGSIVATKGEGSATMIWPAASYSTSGPFKGISAVAAGLDSLQRYKGRKERAEAIGRLFPIDPTTKDLTIELQSREFAKEVIDGTVAGVNSSGWAGMYAKVTEKMTMRKGQWEEVTGERYGSKKAVEWFPANYTPAIDGKTADELLATFAEKVKAHEAAIAASAISAEEVENLCQIAERRPALETQEQEAKKAVEAAKETEAAARAEVTRLRKLKASSGQKPAEHACPHCGGVVYISGDKIVTEVTGMTTEEADILNNNITAAIEQETKARKAREDADALWANAFNAVNSAISAEARLKDAPKGDMADWAAIEATARAEKDRAEADLDAFNRKTRASELAAGIASGQLLADILGPDGLRKTKLTEALRDINTRLEELATAAEFAEVRMTEEFTLTLGGRAVEICSGSERYKAEALLQILIAERDGSEVVLLDGADIITDKAGRNGLFRMLNEAARVNALVFMSFHEAAAMPNLSVIGEHSYWIEKGVVDGAVSE